MECLKQYTGSYKLTYVVLTPISVISVSLFIVNEENKSQHGLRKLLAEPGGHGPLSDSSPENVSTGGTWELLAPLSKLYSMFNTFSLLLSHYILPFHLLPTVS